MEGACDVVLGQSHTRLGGEKQEVTQETYLEASFGRVRLGLLDGGVGFTASLSSCLSW